MHVTFYIMHGQVMTLGCNNGLIVGWTLNCGKSIFCQNQDILIAVPVQENVLE